jgi:hypothetical protein
VTEKELYACIVCAGLLLLFFVGLLIVKIRTKKLVEPNDGFLYGLGFIMLLYLFFPDNFPVELMELRLQFIAYLILFLWIASTCRHRIFSWLLSLSLFTLFIVLSFLRAPFMQRTDEALQEILKVKEHLPPYASLLMLNFSHHGKDARGNVLNKKTGIFLHAHQYLSETKPLLFLDNYEANTGYFPLNYAHKLNPYKLLGDDLESEQPVIEIESYERISNRTIDYIGYVFYDTALLRQPLIAKTNGQVLQQYTEVYRSPNSLVILYKRKSSPLQNTR